MYPITTQPWDQSVSISSQGQVALLGAGWYVSLHSPQVSKEGRCSRQGKPLSFRLIWAVCLATQPSFFLCQESH